MNNMGFFNPFGSSSSGGGGGGGSTANYSVKTFTDSSGQVSYKLTKNGTAVGDVISFNGSNMLVNYGGELVVLNSAIAGIEEALDKTYNFTTFTELGINTQNKTLSQLSAELAAKNLEEGTVVTGRVYSKALPYNNYGNAEVLVNNSILWWKTSSSTISPYSWNAIVVGNTVKMDWTPTYYQLPIASAQSLGGVKIGDNVQIAPDGTISVITTKGDTGTGIASIVKTSSSGLDDIYTITYTDSTTSTFTVTNGATITGGSIGQTGHLILTMSDGRTIDAGALPTDNEVEVTTTSSQPADPNVELWVDLSTQQTLDIPEINDSSTSSTQDTWSCKKIYDEQQRQETEIGAVANRGAKNILTPTLTSESTKEGITCTPNPDGTFTLNGTFPSTSSETNVYFVVVNNAKIKELSNKYGAINVICSGGSDIERSQGRLRFYKIDTNEGTYDSSATNKEVSLTLSDNIMDSSANISIVVYRGQTLNNVVIRPMIRPASITDSTFQPYALSNPVLTPALIEQVDNGAKNHCTLASGSSTPPTRWINIPVSNVGVGQWVMSFGTLISTDTDDTLCQAICFNSSDQQVSNWVNFKRESNTNKIFTVTDTVSYVRLYPANSYAASNGDTVTFTNGMICTAADWAVSQKFVPYAPANRELYKTGQQSYDFIFGLGTALNSNDDLNNYNKVGKIYAATGAIAATISNTPWTLSGFTVITIPMLTETTFIQFLFPNTSGGKWYKRRYTTGAWSAWTEYDGTQ